MSPNNKLKLISFFILIPLSFFAQDRKLSSTPENEDNIYLTWDKNTLENEMKDDCKALSDKGITIKYSDVKRNKKEEITCIKIEYSDRKGNKGNLEYNNQNPIAAIKFYKNRDEIGFGEPVNNITGNDFMNRLSNPQDIMKQFNFGNDGDNSQSYSFSFPNDIQSLGQSKSKIIIQKEGKKPLVIEDQKIIEGGEDYTQEELDKIKNENKFESFGSDSQQPNNKEFDFRNQQGLDNFKKQMEKMEIEMSKLKPKSENNEFNKTKQEMLEAKEEMIKAKEELEKVKKELEKSKSSLKTKKI